MQVIFLKNFPYKTQDSILLQTKDGNFIYNIEEDLFYKINLKTTSKTDISESYEKAKHDLNLANKEDLNVCFFDLGNAAFIIEEKDAVYIDLNTCSIISGKIKTSDENGAENPTAFLNSDIKNGAIIPTDFQTVKIKCWAKENKGGEQ